MNHFADILYNIELNNQNNLSKQLDYCNITLGILTLVIFFFLFTIVFIFIKFNWCNYIQVIDDSSEYNEIITTNSLNKETPKIKDLNFEVFDRYHLLRSRIFLMKNNLEIH